MPKQVYKIQRFDGGLNNNSDPRDIGETHLAAITNFSIDNLGKLTIGQELKDETAVTCVNTNSFNWFLPFSSDYTGLNGAATSLGATNYIAYASASADIKIANEDFSQISSAYTITNLSGPIFYWVNGALRIYDSYMATSTTYAGGNWLGYIPARTLGTGIASMSNSISAGWYRATASLKGAFPTYTANDNQGDLCQNALLVNTQDHETYASAGPTGSKAWSLQNDRVGTYIVATGTPLAAARANSGMHWGFAMEFDTGANDSGYWMPDSNTNYRFQITTMYDDHTQESSPQILQHWVDGDLAGGSSDINYLGSNPDAQIKFCPAGAVGSAGTNSTNKASGTSGENVSVWFKPYIKWNYLADTTKFNFGASSIGEVGDNGNKRISGVKLYWSDSSDNYSSLWLMMDIKFDEGVRILGAAGSTTGAGGYAPFVEGEEPPDSSAANKNDVATFGLSTNQWEAPPRFERYATRNQHFASDNIEVEAFRTVCIANKRAYIGNVRINGTVYGDRIIKSPPKQYDKFPEGSIIDTQIDDGDEITHLSEFADRLLIFKKKALYIVNISGAKEAFESKNDLKGVYGSPAVCRTDFGVAWINKHGCYLYDGRVITNLLEEKGMLKIKLSDWNTAFDGTTNAIGYNPTRRELVLKSDTTGEFYIYNLVTKGWTFSNAYGTASASANIDNLHNGDLFTMDASENKMYTLQTRASAAANSEMLTRDIDFGDPSRRKKVYKVYISYRGTGTNVNINYGTDGGTCSGTFNTCNANGTTTGSGTNNNPLDSSDVGSTTWVKAELKPSSAINNINTFQLKISGTIQTDFEINDISIVYRDKGVK
tara:strand:- start:3491 stop:5974 length:2484 start_codon:yes stop_codon:yes gene_type:complete